jgi:hypothetical protein
MWKTLSIPYFCERLIAFSIPEDDEVWVMSYEGLHRITLRPEVRIWTDPEHAEDYDVYDADQGVLNYRGRQYPMLGLHDGEPLLRGPRGELLELDDSRERLMVRDRQGGLKQVIGYGHSDWAMATFSVDGSYLVLGTDERFQVFQETVTTPA